MPAADVPTAHPEASDAGGTDRGQSGRPAVPPAAEGAGIPRRLVRRPLAVLVTIVLLATAGGILYSLVSLWPQSPGAATATTVRVFSVRLTVESEQRVLILVALTGALGGIVHALRSVYWYVGNRMLYTSWLAMYACLPFVGATLATVFYLILRGGLIPASAGTAGINLFGFAAVAALVGLFSSQAAEKLKQVFATIFAPAEQGKDRAMPTIKAVRPTSGRVNSQVQIFGDQLSETTEVIFPNAMARAEVRSSGEVTATVPEGAESGPICIRVGGAYVPGPNFEVEAGRERRRATT